MAANSLTDADSAEILSKILLKHSEYRDEVFWKYGLRNELPPPSEVVGIKKLDVSHNKLAAQTCYYFGNVLRTDRYVLAINLRSNQITHQSAKDLFACLANNNTLFNLDLRNNPDINPGF